MISKSKAMNIIDHLYTELLEVGLDPYVVCDICVSTGRELGYEFDYYLSGEIYLVVETE